MAEVPITAIVLAGGRGTRMQGQDKGLMNFKNRPIIEHVVDCLTPQVREIRINANRHLSRYEAMGYPVFSDIMPGFLGPLSGVYSGLLEADHDWIVSVSCDTPYLPTDLVSRLWQGLNGKLAAYVHDGERSHPTLLLINKQLLSPLKIYLETGERKLHLFLTRIDAQVVDFSDCPHCFININTSEQLNYWSQQ